MTEAGTKHAPARRIAARRWWLLLTIPISLVGVIAAAVGIATETTFVPMTEEWADQTFAQDVADLLVAFPALALSGWLASRGSIRALLVWLGVLIALVYTYVIYAFDVPFGRLYLVNVALLGMSGWALAGAASAIRGDRLRAHFDDRTPTRSTGAFLIAIGVLFYAMWLAEDLPAVLRGSTPETLEEVALPTNPVHVLDMAFLLPACVIAGVALIKRRALGYWLAPALLTALATITVGIVAIMAVAIRDGDTSAYPVAAAMTAAGAAQVLLLVRFLRRLDPAATHADILT